MDPKSGLRLVNPVVGMCHQRSKHLVRLLTRHVMLHVVFLKVVQKMKHWTSCRRTNLGVVVLRLRNVHPVLQ
jgi:hypothetical protein